MKLLLSSDAAPAASMTELTRACRRRALAGLEVTAGSACGARAGRGRTREQAAGARGEDDPARVHWLRVPPGTSAGWMHVWASSAHRLGAGLLLPAPWASPPKGLRLALVHGTDPAGAQRAARWAERYSAQTCWAVTPDASQADLEAVLDATGDSLGHVRLLGAGPEAQASGATGANPLWQALALRGYAGTVALAPSPGTDLDAWHRWLFDARGWGCNTAAEKKDRAASSSTTFPTLA